MRVWRRSPATRKIAFWIADMWTVRFSPIISRACLAFALLTRAYRLTLCPLCPTAPSRTNSCYIITHHTIFERRRSILSYIMMPSQHPAVFSFLCPPRFNHLRSDCSHSLTGICRTTVFRPPPSHFYLSRASFRRFWICFFPAISACILSASHARCKNVLCLSLCLSARHISVLV